MYIFVKTHRHSKSGPNERRPSGKCSELESTKDYRPESKRTVVFRLTNDS